MPHPDIDPPTRILMGPGPSDVPPRVLRALSTPPVGHLDPYYLQLMDEMQHMLREVFHTENRLTLAMPGTGSAGMETCFANVLEVGDVVVVGVNGVFGNRMCEVAERCGARVVRVEAPWGETVPEQTMVDAIHAEQPKLVALVHAETSTGVWQPVEAIARAAREADSLMLLDCVTSLGGAPVELDGWGIDLAYAGTQKCLSCPPGLAPVSVNDRALEAIHGRRTKVQSWYLDLTMLESYWGSERAYHHTAPISMSYALYEALRIVLDEGLEARFERHRHHHEMLVAGLEAMGLELAVDPSHRLWMLNSVQVPAGVDEAVVRRQLLEEHGIEIGAGLGPLKGRVWRIGLMGASCTRNHVLLLLAALERCLHDAGHEVAGSGVQVALRA